MAPLGLAAVSTPSTRSIGHWLSPRRGIAARAGASIPPPSNRSSPSARSTPRPATPTATRGRRRHAPARSPRSRTSVRGSIMAPGVDLVTNSVTGFTAGAQPTGLRQGLRHFVLGAVRGRADSRADGVVGRGRRYRPHEHRDECGDLLGARWLRGRAGHADGHRDQPCPQQYVFDLLRLTPPSVASGIADWPR